MGNTDKYEMLKLESQLCFPLYVVSKEIVRKYKPFLNEVKDRCGSGNLEEKLGEALQSVRALPYNLEHIIAYPHCRKQQCGKNIYAPVWG